MSPLVSGGGRGYLIVKSQVHAGTQPMTRSCSAPEPHRSSNRGAKSRRSTFVPAETTGSAPAYPKSRSHQVDQMEPQICVNCRNLLTSGWSQGFHHHQKPSSRRINFLRSSQRSAPQHPTFTHSGRRSALSQCDSESSQCPLCRELRALLVARDRKGRKGPGQVKWTKPTVASFPLGRDLVGRASDALDAVAKLWRDPDVFTVRFEYTTSGPNPNQVYIHTDSGWSFAWFKIFVERGK